MRNNLKIPTFSFHEVRLDLVLGEQEGLVKMERERKMGFQKGGAGKTVGQRLRKMGPLTWVRKFMKGRGHSGVRRQWQLEGG